METEAKHKYRQYNSAPEHFRLLESSKGLLVSVAPVV